MTIDDIMIILSAILIIVVVVRIYHVTTKDVELYQIQYDNYSLQRV